MSKPILYVDQDDTINEYSRYHRHRRQMNPKNEYPQMEYGFFLNIDPISEYLPHIFRELSHYFDVWILTRPSVQNPLCYTEKRVWIEKHLGIEWCDKLILCPDKGLMKGDFLVDDVLWEDFEGEQILFGSEGFETWSKVTPYLIKKVKEDS
jgi:5'(3')-deoxyribonucleotidase